MCRGLITDLEGRIVARPFQKFFNLEEHEGEDSKLPYLNWKQDFIATRKLDGSLGILYQAEGKPCIATRGSFTSDQAEEGQRILEERGYSDFAFDSELTYLFEIIYPQNRIVVDYGGQRDLILLDVVRNEDGTSPAYGEIHGIAQRIGCPVVPDIGFGDVKLRIALAEYSKQNLPNEEGLVVRFDDGTRFKVKFEDYKRLHRLITGVNARHIWENLAAGNSLDELMDRVPDEFMEWVKKTVASLRAAFTSHEKNAQEILDSIVGRLGPDASRKDLALEIVKHKGLSSVMFHMLNGKDPAPLIWKMLKPISSTPFKDDPDA